jgi:alkylation response protein AidB-like acyl-CoA dehydrogenase
MKGGPVMYLELNMELTDDQIALKEAVHKFAREVMRPASIKLDAIANPDDVIKKGSVLWDVFRKAYELGYNAILIPETHGGLGLSPLEVALVLEEMAWGSIGLTIGIGVACFPAFFGSMFDDDRIINTFVTPFTADKKVKVIGCWGITEPDHGSDGLMAGTRQFHDPAITFQVRAAKDGDSYVLNGQKAAWISNGTIATQSTTFLTIDPSTGMAGGGICLVPLDLPGVSKGKPLNKMGQRDLNQGEIFFDNVRIPAEFMISDPESYESMTDLTLATANAAMGAMHVGAARAAFEEALGYARERIQGGKPIAQHQVIRAKLFDMFMNTEAARALARSAMIYNYSNTPPEVHYSIASKVFSTETAFRCASEGIQILGGNGLSREYIMEKLFRDTRASMIEDGANEILGQTAAEKIVSEYDVS